MIKIRDLKTRVKRFLSDLILKRNNNNISLVNYLGVQIYGFDNQKITQKLKLGLYEEMEELIFLKSKFRSDDVFIDIGANIGVYTVLASKYVNKVIAFEPINKNIALIQLSLINSNSENTMIYQNIVSDHDTNLQFMEVGQSGLSLAISEDKEKVKKYIKNNYGEDQTKINEYKCITIDSLNLIRVDIMKIDIEGFELKAIVGAIETLKRCRPRLIMLEIVERVMMLNGDKPENLIALLKNLGYSPKILSRESLIDYVNQNIPRDNLFFLLEEKQLSN